MIHWVVVDGDQGVLDDLADGAQVAGGGGDEDLGRVHGWSGVGVPKAIQQGLGA